MKPTVTSRYQQPLLYQYRVWDKSTFGFLSEFSYSNIFWFDEVRFSSFFTLSRLFYSSKFARYTGLSYTVIIRSVKRNFLEMAYSQIQHVSLTVQIQKVRFYCFKFWRDDEVPLIYLYIGFTVIWYYWTLFSNVL